MRNSNLNLVEEVLLVYSGNEGDYVTLNFMDKSIEYRGTFLCQAFTYVLIDNNGSGGDSGKIRITYNDIWSDLSSPAQGTKTLLGNDSIFLEEEILSIRIYFIETSSIELILKAKMYED